jgi:glucokinase
MKTPPVLALDVGGSSVKSVVVEAGPRILSSVSVNAIRSKSSAVEILTTLAGIIEGHLQNCRGIRGVAFAFPGPFDYEQGICLIQNLDKYDALYGIDISANLRKILGLPGLEIRYRNDAEAAILGEARYGAGEPYSRLLGLTLGTGLGSAFLVNRELVTEGADVPERGWLYTLPYGTKRADDVFSTRGLLARLQARGLEADDIASAIQMAGEDRTALIESFASFAQDLSVFLEPFVSKFRADAVLITGGIAEAWDLFAPSLIRLLAVPVVKATLGRRAPLLGAAALYM